MVEEDAGAISENGPKLNFLREQVCSADLNELYVNLDMQLARDAGLVWRLAWLRRELLQEVQRSFQPGRRNKDGGPLYEFNNIFARFYIAARNKIAEMPLAEGNLADAYNKMLSEIAEKNMEGPKDKLVINSLEDLPEAPQLEDVLVELTQHEDEHQTKFTFCGVSMVLPRSREQCLRRHASSFVASAGAEAGKLTERILKVTVLNYILASSSLYWGFGPAVYKRAISIGAVLECFASPFNHSLPVFCSPCAPLDLIYGSLGSFYSSRIDAFLSTISPGSLIVANPPYLESELAACFARVDELVLAKGLRAISIFPKWDGCKGVEQFRARAQGEHGLVVVLEPNCHAYYDYQDAKIIPARFASLGFALSSATLGQKQSFALRSIFEAVQCANSKRHRKQNHQRSEARIDTPANTTFKQNSPRTDLEVSPVLSSVKQKDSEMPTSKERRDLSHSVHCSDLEIPAKRLRVQYDGPEESKRIVVAVPPRCGDLVEDFSTHLQERLQSAAPLHASVSLAVDGFVLPPKQKLHDLIRDGDVVTLSKARTSDGSERSMQ